jgi:hypothetical protein
MEMKSKIKKHTKTRNYQKSKKIKGLKNNKNQWLIENLKHKNEKVKHISIEEYLSR